MKKKTQLHNVEKVLSFALLLVAFASCQKDTTPNSTTTTSSAASPSVIASEKAIAVSASRTAAGDSIYVIGTCANGHHTDSISFSSLPSAVDTYLASNYAGYTFQKAYADKDTSGTVTGYVVIIQYNGSPIGLKFDASGNFLKILEQREGHDLQGHGWHQGGEFDDRGDLKHDTITLSTLPNTITLYFSSNYSSDTLIHAYKNRDSSIVVISRDNGLFATVFDTNGNFIKRIELTEHTDKGRITSITQTALPSAIQTYLSTTYPNYVFKEGFQVTANGTLVGYVVFITANSTKYAAEFDASGNFIKAVTIR